MDTKKILNATDHTLLAPDSTWEQIKEVIDDAIKYNCASVCIPASFVERAVQYADGRMKICTVIGFPTGYSTTETKMAECENSVQNGADEIDMVINIGALKDKDYSFVLDEIKAIRAACKGKILKVIIETCLLSDEEKIKMCEIVSASDADYIKTSTGFSTGGATLEDVKLFAKHITPPLKIKAAGGISSLEDAENFLSAGASRLGTSRIVKIVKGV